MIEKCPVCEGRGVVPAGFYNPYGKSTLPSIEPEECRSCNGTGWINPYISKRLTKQVPPPPYTTG